MEALRGLDIYITGNYGEWQFKGVCKNVDCEDYDDCSYHQNQAECSADYADWRRDD